APWLLEAPFEPQGTRPEMIARRGLNMYMDECSPLVPQVFPCQRLVEQAFQGAGQEFASVKVLVQETPTGSWLFGVGVNSDAGVAGSITPAEPIPSPTRPTFTMPCLTRLRPSVRRNLVASLLFVVHPLMTLTPTDELLDMPS